MLNVNVEVFNPTEEMFRKRSEKPMSYLWFRWFYFMCFSILQGTNAQSESTTLIAGGMMGGQRPNQGKSTSYHLTPSLLEDVLNEKKMVHKVQTMLM